MGFLDRFFGKKSALEPQPDIKFGRYTDSYKTNANYEAWDKSLDCFEKQEYLEAYRQFFIYLRDEEEDNVKVWEERGNLYFELYQGSKKITGYANEQKLQAEAKVAKTEILNVGFMRRLMEQNFGLKYTRFALDKNNHITIVFTSYALDGSPYKIYYALKELAVNADKQDDLLVDEFKMLQEVDNSHLQELAKVEKEAKYNFIIKEIKAVFEEIDDGKLNSSQYPGAVAYLFLNLVYKLDYLTKPEGYTMEVLERIHRLYFTKDNNSNIQKNKILRKEFKKLLERPKDKMFAEMYKVVTTFGITTPVNHDKVVSFIDGELHNMDWYHENKHHKVALSIPGYIIGYCLFNYAIPKPDRELFHLYFQVVEASYFKSLGFTTDYYNCETTTFDKKAIRRAISAIVEKNKEKYPKLNPVFSTLKFDNLVGFAKSFLLMVRNLNMTKVE